MRRLPEKKVASIILAGGESKRMGRDKAFLLLGKKPFIQIIAEKLSKFSDQIIISTNKDEKNYIPYLKNISSDIIFVKDKDPHSGPLNGIVSCRKHIKKRYIFISTCDTPLIKEDIIPFLMERVSGFQAVVPEVKTKLQFLNTVYEKSAVDIADRVYNREKKRSLHKWIKSLKFNIITEKDIKIIDKDLLTYWSINTPEDYKRLITLWEEKSGF